MSPDRQIVRLMAAMILAIIASVAPSAVQAHEGHAHHGHRAVAAAQPKVAPAIATVPAKPAVRFEASASPRVALPVAAVEPTRIEVDRDGGCCPGPCKTRCCGPMVCCATAILSSSYALSPSLLRTITLIPCDVASRSDTGPEALPKPPRTLA